MDYITTFSISAAGMNLERARVETAALNLANANTAIAPNGSAYRPLRVVAYPGILPRPLVDSAFMNSMRDARAVGAPEFSVHSTDVDPRMVYEPGHPLSNQRGFVAYAGVNPATEMISLIGATRAYEANVAAMNTSRTLALKALEIGRAG